MLIVLIYSQKNNFADLPLCTLLLIQIHPDSIHFLKNNGRSQARCTKTRIPGFNLCLAFQVRDFASEIYTTNTQVEGSLGLLMWHFPQGTFTGKSQLGLGKFTTTNLFTPSQGFCSE